MARTAKSPEVEVVQLQQDEVSFCLLGVTPFYCNRPSVKVKRTLLFPSGRMTSAQKAANLKHDPEGEFRSSPYLRRGDGPTRIQMRATALKGAMGQAAIDMPTAVAKAQIDRLTFVVNEFIDIYGIPLLDMDIVRMADQARTPDIRTRAKIFPWATRVTVRYTLPMLSAQKVATLISSSGRICGIGDYRQQKGKGNNGLFEIVPQDHPEFLAVVASGGMAAQDEALKNPVTSNAESEDLMVWYNEELHRRGAEPANQDDEPEEDEAQPEAAE